MKRFEGIAVSPGVAIGRVLALHKDELDIREKKITESDVPNEIARFEDALTKTRAELLGIRKQISTDIGRDHSDIFNAHLLILEDRTLIEEVISRLKDELVCVEHIFSTILVRYFEAFANINDEYLKERTADIKDVGKRVLGNLLGKPKEMLDNVEDMTVVVSHDLSPSETASMQKDKVLAFATDIGGPTSHTAIMARSLEIPAVVGLEDITKNVFTGDTIIIDGNAGIVIVNPDQETISKYHTEEQKYVEHLHALEKYKDLSAVTKDDVVINVVANIESALEIRSAKAHGAEGIGLFRTEFFYMNRSDLPTEEEQYIAYKQVAEAMNPKPVVIRTLDLGGDKFASALDIPHEMNPFMGWRAIRYCLARVDLFKNQLRAILRASAHGKLKIMYPMISTLCELRQANKIVDEVKVELREKGVPFDEDILIGAMIETPSAAITADLLAEEASFFSIGTNDLIQYSMAVDRVNERIAYLYVPTHPAILRFVKAVADAGKKTGVTVGMCGEMAGDIYLAVLIIGLGLRQLSVSPYLVPQLKKIIRMIDVRKAEVIAKECLEFSSGDKIKEHLKKRVDQEFPDLTKDDI